MNESLSQNLAFLDGGTMVLLAFGVLVVFFLLWAIGAYNGLIRLRNMYRNAFAQIDVQLKRRHDLIPNLVETAKSFMKHERETLEAVIQARNAAASARDGLNPDDAAQMQGLMAAEAGLGSMMTKFFALAEAYPDLKSNQNMMQVSEELTTTENKVSFSRQAYNDAATLYNTKIEVVPSNIIAGMFNFKAAVLFEVSSEAEREAVKVSFD
jgi:LemA protein